MIVLGWIIEGVILLYLIGFDSVSFFNVQNVVPV